MKIIVFLALTMMASIGFNSSAYARKATPKPATLEIKTARGAVLFRYSKGCDASECVIYSRKPVAIPGMALVKADETGDDVYLLVDNETGSYTEIFGEPTVSPDKTMFVTSSFDEMNGTDKTEGTFLWAIGKENRISVIAHMPLEVLAGTKVLQWQNPLCVSITGQTGWGTGEMASANAALQISKDRSSAAFAKDCR